MDGQKERTPQNDFAERNDSTNSIVASQGMTSRIEQVLSRPNSNETPEQQRSVQREFIQLQIIFAHQAARVCRDPFEKSLLTYTTLYRQFGLPLDANKELDNQNVQWKEFLLHVDSDEKLCTAALGILDGEAAKEKMSQCFSYTVEDEVVNIHFTNNDPYEKGPLSDERLEIRKAELKSLFSEIHGKFPQAKNVRGISWLYSMANYRRLFPPSYTDKMGTPRPDVTSKSIWGQFFNRAGGLRRDRAQEFLKKVEKAENEEDLLDSFPLRGFSAGCSIQDFYSFYSIA